MEQAIGCHGTQEKRGAATHGMTRLVFYEQSKQLKQYNEEQEDHPS